MPSTKNTAAAAPRKKTAPKKTASKKTAGRTGAKKTSAASGRKRRKKAFAWWTLPVTALMLTVLIYLGVTVMNEKKQYEQFNAMRQAVDIEGFYPGIRIGGKDVTGRSLQDVLLEFGREDQSIRAALDVTFVGGGSSWHVTAEELGYTSDYEQQVRAAWQIGHEGSISERYRAIRQIQESGSDYPITRGYDESLLRGITDSVARQLSSAAKDAKVVSFDVVSKTFHYSQESTGTFVDAEGLYRSAHETLASGQGGQTLFVNVQTVYPNETVDHISSQMGLIASAQTKVSGNRNRRSNVQLALSTLNGRRVESGEVFSFNGIVGERTEAAGYKMAGAFIDGLSAEEVGGGICQVSTTLFNAIAKADLELISRSAHSRPVAYVDKGKDAAVSWPSQDFRFMNDTPYPVFIYTSYDEESRQCYVAIYGQTLENGVYITIEAEVIEEIEPGEDVYVYTSELPTGYKEVIEEARYGYKCESYKVYHSADGKVTSRELYCRSSYPAAGARYKVGL